MAVRFCPTAMSRPRHRILVCGRPAEPAGPVRRAGQVAGLSVGGSITAACFGGPAARPNLPSSRLYYAIPLYRSALNRTARVSFSVHCLVSFAVLSCILQVVYHVPCHVSCPHCLTPPCYVVRTTRSDLHVICRTSLFQHGYFLNSAVFVSALRWCCGDTMAGPRRMEPGRPQLRHRRRFVRRATCATVQHCDAGWVAGVGLARCVRQV